MFRERTDETRVTKDRGKNKKIKERDEDRETK